MNTEQGMKQVGGVWLPEHEKHLIEWMQHPKNLAKIDGKLAYQWKKQLAAMALVRNFRCAVDIGAHCGLWSMHLVKQFTRVWAFEPVALHRECFRRNVPMNEGVVLIEGALGEFPGNVSMHTTKGSSGDSWVAPGDGDIPMQRLDHYELQDVDFIKVDCEGYELPALRGGEETLKRCRPTIIVEQKPNRPAQFKLPPRGAVDYLESLGAVLVQEISGDFFMRWPD